MTLDPHFQALIDAAWQILDDMRDDSHCCSGLAKAQLRVAFEPFRDLDDPDSAAELMPLAQAVEIMERCK